MKLVGSIVSTDKKKPSIRTFISEQLTGVTTSLRASSVDKDVTLQTLPPKFFAVLCELAREGVFSELEIEKRPEPATPSVICLATQSVATRVEAVERVLTIVATAERFADQQGWIVIEPGLNEYNASQRWRNLCQQVWA